VSRPQGLVVAGFGLGQIVAFASSFYLIGVLGDAMGRDLGVSATFVFATVSLSLAVPAFAAPTVARRIDTKGGKGVLPLHLWGERSYAYRSAILGRPALFAQIAGPTVFADALERSATGAVLLTSALCLLMFAMTYGLARHAPSTQEPAIA
jgi:hypothetical protein